MRIAVLGQIDGPIGGQSRLTQAFRDGTRCRTSFFEFFGHKSWLGPAILLWQALRATVLVLGRRVDVAYIAASRSTFGMFRDLFLLLPFMAARVPVVAHVHGAEFDGFYLEDSRFGWFKAFYLDHVARFIFVNEVFVPRDSELSARSAFVRNPVPAFVNEAIARSDGTGARPSPGARQRPCFGFISTFAREKGIELFLDAAEHFAAQADFVVAGGPSMEDERYGQRILERIDAMPEVDYLGYLSNPIGFYERCDFMIFPTNFASETSSLVVIEALATRTLPIVRRHNRLTDIFGAAPVRWFEDRQGLMQAIEAALAAPAAELEAERDVGVPWVLATFPSETQWVERVEDLVVAAARAKRA